MLNIEVIKFEAQDVITASVATPVTPAPAPVATKHCQICDKDIPETEWKSDCLEGWKHMWTY